MISHKGAVSKHSVTDRESATTASPSPDMISVAAFTIYVVLELIENFEGVRECEASEIGNFLELDVDLDIAEIAGLTLDSELGSISWEDIVTIVGVINRLEDLQY